MNLDNLIVHPIHETPDIHIPKKTKYQWLTQYFIDNYPYVRLCKLRILLDVFSKFLDIDYDYIENIENYIYKKSFINGEFNESNYNHYIYKISALLDIDEKTCNKYLVLGIINASITAEYLIEANDDILSFYFDSIKILTEKRLMAVNYNKPTSILYKCRNKKCCDSKTIVLKAQNKKNDEGLGFKVICLSCSSTYIA